DRSLIARRSSLSESAQTLRAPGSSNRLTPRPRVAITHFANENRFQNRWSDSQHLGTHRGLRTLPRAARAVQGARRLGVLADPRPARRLLSQERKSQL